MKVNIFDCVAGHDVLRGTADLAEVLPDADERAHAEEYLKRVGRYWLGGEAAPLVLLQMAKV